MRRQKRLLLCTTNHWHYENKRGTIKKPYKNATRNAKNFFNFFQNCWVLGPFSKNLCFWKMGMAGIKWSPCLSTRPSFSVHINKEAFLKVSFKNIDWFEIWKNYFFKRERSSAHASRTYFFSFTQELWDFLSSSLISSEIRNRDNLKAHE